MENSLTPRMIGDNSVKNMNFQLQIPKLPPRLRPHNQEQFLLCLSIQVSKQKEAQQVSVQ
jgi:hypothetical protein